MGSYNPPQLEQLSPLHLDSFGDFLRNCDLAPGADQSTILKLFPPEYHSRLNYHPGRQVWTLNVKGIAAINLPLHIAGAPVLPIDWETPGYKGSEDNVDPLMQCNTVPDETIEALRDRYPDATAFVFLIDSTVLVLGSKGESGTEHDDNGTVKIGGFTVVLKPDMTISPASTTPSPTAKSNAEEISPGAVVHVRGWKYHGKNGTEPLAGVERGNIGLRIKDNTSGDEFYTGTSHHRYISVAKFIEIARELESVAKEEKRSREGIWERLRRRFTFVNDETGDEYGLEAFNPENIKALWLGNGNDSLDATKLGWYSESFDPTASVHQSQFPHNYQHDLSLIPCRTDSPHIAHSARLYWAPFTASSNEKVPLQLLGVRQSWRVPIGEAYVRMAHPNENGGHYARASIWRGINDCRDVVVSGAPIGTPNMPGDSFGVMGFQNFSVCKKNEKAFSGIGDRDFNLEFWGGFRLPKGFVEKFDIVQHKRPGQNSIHQNVIRGDHHPPKIVDVVEKALEKCNKEVEERVHKADQPGQEKEHPKTEEDVSKKMHEINKTMDQGQDMFLGQDKEKEDDKGKDIDRALHKEMDRGENIPSGAFAPGEPTNAEIREQYKYAQEHRRSPSVPESPIPDTETSTLFPSQTPTTATSPPGDISPPPSPADVKDIEAKQHSLDKTLEEALQKPIPIDEMQKTHIHITDYDKCINKDKLEEFEHRNTSGKEKPHLESYAAALEQGHPSDPSIKLEAKEHVPSEDEDIVLTPGGGMSQDDSLFKKSVKKKYTKEELQQMEAEAERRADAFQWAMEHAGEPEERATLEHALGKPLPKDLDPHNASVMAQIIEAETKEMAIEDSAFNKNEDGDQLFTREQLQNMEAEAERRADSFQFALEHADDDVHREILSRAAGKELPVDRDAHKAEVMAAIISAEKKALELGEDTYSGTSSNVGKVSKGKGKEKAGPGERHEFHVPVKGREGKTPGGIFVEHVEDPLTEKDKSNTVNMREELDLEPKDGNFADLKGQGLIENQGISGSKQDKTETAKNLDELDIPHKDTTKAMAGSVGPFDTSDQAEDDFWNKKPETDRSPNPFDKSEGDITESKADPFNSHPSNSALVGTGLEATYEKKENELSGAKIDPFNSHPEKSALVDTGLDENYEKKENELSGAKVDPFNAHPEKSALVDTGLDENYEKKENELSGAKVDPFNSHPEKSALVDTGLDEKYEKAKGEITGAKVDPFNSHPSNSALISGATDPDKMDEREDMAGSIYADDRTANRFDKLEKDISSPKVDPFNSQPSKSALVTSDTAPETSEGGRNPFDETEDKMADPIENINKGNVAPEVGEQARQPFEKTEGQMTEPVSDPFNNDPSKSAMVNLGDAAPEAEEWSRKPFEESEDQLTDAIENASGKNAAPETSEWAPNPFDKTGKQLVDNKDNLYSKETPPGGISDTIQTENNPFAEDTGKQVTTLPADVNPFGALNDEGATSSENDFFANIARKGQAMASTANDKAHNLAHKASDIASNVNEKAHTAASKASDIASKAKETAQSAAHTSANMASKAKETAQSAAHSSADMASKAKETAQSAAHKSSEIASKASESATYAARQSSEFPSKIPVRASEEIPRETAHPASDHHDFISKIPVRSSEDTRRSLDTTEPTDFFSGATAPTTHAPHTEPTDFHTEPSKAVLTPGLNPDKNLFEPSAPSPSLDTPLPVPEPADWLSTAFADPPAASAIVDVTTISTTETTTELNAGHGASLFEDVLTPGVENKHLHGLDTLEETMSHEEDLTRVSGESASGITTGEEKPEIPDLAAPSLGLKKEE